MTTIQRILLQTSSIKKNHLFQIISWTISTKLYTDLDPQTHLSFVFNVHDVSTHRRTINKIYLLYYIDYYSRNNLISSNFNNNNLTTVSPSSQAHSPYNIRSLVPAKLTHFKNSRNFFIASNLSNRKRKRKKKAKIQRIRFERNLIQK